MISAIVSIFLKITPVYLFYVISLPKNAGKVNKKRIPCFYEAAPPIWDCQKYLISDIVINGSKVGRFHMLTSKKIPFFILYFVGSLIITGCLNQKTVEEKMFDVLEKVVAVEKGYEDQQQPLVELEKQEKNIYENLITIGMKDQAQVTKLADEALSIANKRKEHLLQEQKSIEASEREFETLIPLIAKLNNAELEGKADELTKVMKERYEIYRKLSNYYIEGVDLDSELYQLIKDRSGENLESHVSLINKTYDEVLQANDQFNKLTKKYNKMKLNFYKDAGLNVKAK
jgi:hypothetical protein